MLAPIIISLILSFIYFLSGAFFNRIKKAYLEITSFSSGMFISYIFLTLFPELFKSMAYLGNNGLFIALWGFVVLYIIEKYVMQHIKNYFVQRKRLLEIRMFGFFTNHFMLGFALVFFFKEGFPVMGYVTAIPLTFHMFSSALLSEELHRRFHETMLGKIVSSFTIFFGALVSIWLYPSAWVYFAILSFVTGTFLYVVVRDVMPKEREGNVYYFLYGVIAYLTALGIGSIVIYLMA